jgi:hypothetical protein
MMDIILLTGSGYWDPLLYLVSVLVILGIAYVIRSRGQGKHEHHHNNNKSLPFYSGNVSPEENIGSENLYWGFFEATKKYYAWLVRMHTGIVNDYVFSLVVLVVVMILALVLGGLS